MPRPKPSRRGREIECTPIIDLENRRMKLVREGKDIVNFAGGEFDLPTPDAIIEEGVKALREGFTRYTEDAGLPELREALCQKFAHENRIHYTTDEVLITPGSKFALYTALQVLCEPSDEILIPAPFWPTYKEQILLARGRPRVISLSRENHFKLTPEALLGSLTEKARVLILNNPVNPTGAVYTRAELEALAEIIVREGLFVIVDEIYEHLVFEVPGHVSLASLGEDIHSQTITVGGWSKNFSMTGWRIGFAAGPRDVVSAMKGIQSQVTSCANAAAQKAAVIALSGGPVRELKETLRVRRDALLDGLENLPGLSPLFPSAGFYIFVEVSPELGFERKGKGKAPVDSASLANALLEEASVSLLPGSIFEAEGYLRLTFAPTPLSRIEEGVNRLRTFFASK